MDIITSDSIQIDAEMVNLIAEIEEFKGAFQQMGFLRPDRLSSLKKVATIESIGSSTRIEGAKLSDFDVESLLSQLNLNTSSLESRDEQEVAGYAFVCQLICDHFDSISLTENSIKHLHSMLLQYTEKDGRHKGEYKKVPITIEAFDSAGKSIGVIFETSSPLETPIKMQQLVEWTVQAFEEKRYHPLIIIAIFIVIFLAIHPFQDGNGRLSRLLTTLLMLKKGYSYVPYSSLESVIEANKENYYLALQKTQKSWQKNQPDWKNWLHFFFQCLQRQKRHLEIKLEKEKMIITPLSPLNQQIIMQIKMHGNLSISDIAILIKANRNTIKKALSFLIENKYITKQGLGKSTRYSLFIGM